MRMTLTLLLLFSQIGSALSGSSETKVEAGLKRATQFMVNEASYRGGYVMLYSEDLTQRWGELPARESMIWVQNPGTVGMGEFFLRAYRILRDPFYLQCSEKAASALIFGQHPSGGWHYFIDFEPAKTPNWYDQVGSKCWGWEEFYHHYGNATFDDSVTEDASRFLLNLYLETQDPRYRSPLLDSLQFILDSQYPNGAWPQRYPLNPDMLLDPEVGYTAYYTYNDDIILGNVRYMLEAHRRMGDARYRDSAIKGMDFVLLSQLPEPHAGWAQQYDLNLKPAAARSYEPVALSTLDTYHNIEALGEFYLETGDRRYLDAIPPAIQWLQNSTIPKNHSESGHTHATFIDLEENRPIYGHRQGTSIEEGRYWNDHSPENLLRGYGYTFNLNLEGLWNRYRELSEGDYRTLKENFDPEDKNRSGSPSLESVLALIENLDARGAWVEDLSFSNTDDYMNNPPSEFKGMSTGTFIRNANSILGYIETHIVTFDKENGGE